MKQIRHIVITWGGGVNSALYYHPLTPTQKSSSTLASSATCRMPAAGTLRNLAVQLLAALGGGDAITVRFDHNASAGALTATVTDPATTAADTTNSLTIAAGDQLVLVRTGAGAPAAGVAMISYEWEPSVANTSIYGFGGQNDTVGTATHADGLLDGGGNDWDGLANEIKTLVALTGTINAMRMVQGTACGAGNSRTYTVWKNGVAQDGSGGTPDTRITLTGAGSGDGITFGASSFSLSVVSGDYVHVETSHTGTPAASRACGAVAMVTTDGKWHVGCQLVSPTDNTSTLYIGHSGRSDGTPTTWDATETNRQHIGGITSHYLGGMIGGVLVAPGSGKSITYTLRNNVAGTTQGLTFSDTETSASSSGAAVEIAAVGDLLALQEVPTGTPTVTGSFPKMAWWASNATPIIGSSVFGVDTTVTATRASAFGLDGNTNIHDEAGKLKVFGDFEVTGDVTVTGETTFSTESLTSIFSRLILSDDGELILDEDGNPLFSEE